ncbi:MAG: hypothetical protein ACXWXQ_06460 [Actinomycetota bacterium]
MRVEVVVLDREPNGLAEMLGGLIRANLDRRPGRAALLRPAVIELEAADACVRASVRTAPGRVEIRNGAANPGAHLSILADGPDLLALASAPLRFGLPDPLRGEGREVLRSVLGRRVRISGLLRHPVVLSRFARLLSAR